MIFDFLLILIWMIIVPLFSGTCFVMKKERFPLIEAYVCGYCYLFSLAEILGLTLYLLHQPLHIFSLLYGLIAAVTALLGFGLYVGNAGQWSEKKPVAWKDEVFLIAVLVIMAAMTLYMVFFIHYDADDNFYVGSAAADVFSDSILKINPGTGKIYSSLPTRYLLSQYPTLLAGLSILCGGIDPVTLAHVGYPLALVPLLFAVWYLIGMWFFPEDRQLQGIFVILCAAVTWFSSYSIYNSSIFFMTRTWQGKGSLAGIWLPIVFYLSLRILVDKTSRISAAVLWMAVLSSCLLSTMGIILVPVLVVIMTLIGTVKNRSAGVIVKGLLCASPSLVLGMAYFFIR